MCTASSVYARNLSHTTDLWDTDGPALQVNGTGFEEALFEERVIGLIEGHQGAESPLCLYYAMHLLHSPLCAPQSFRDKFAFIEDEDRRYVAAMINYMDTVVGNVVVALERAKMWDNTILVWSSDKYADIFLAEAHVAR